MKRRRPADPEAFAGRRRDQRGAVTAEAVMVLPLLALVTIALCWCVGVGITQARLVDAARETARLIARDVPVGEAIAAGQAVAPESARISVQAGEDRVVVTARADPGGPAVLGWSPAGELSATAVAVPEQDSG